MKPLFIPLNTEYFELFKAGEKTIEYRLFGPRWNLTTCLLGRGVTLSKGYSGERISGVIIKTKIINNNVTDIYPKKSKLIAIHIIIDRLNPAG